MAQVVAITNQKGGVGKSTTAEALAEGLVCKGKKALLVDLDAQGSISLTAGAHSNHPTIYEVLTGQCEPVSAIQKCEGRSDILPASRNLARLDVELTATGKEYRLRERLAPFLPLYDFIIIDTPPALGVLTVNALTAAHSVIMPAQADIYSLQGIGQLSDTLEAIRAYTNPGLTLAGILLTRHNARSILSRDMADAARETARQMGTFLYNTVIREAVAIKESQASQQSIYQYAPKSNAAADYMAFTAEFLKRSATND
jgi:chromosome partitioning protein